MMLEKKKMPQRRKIAVAELQEESKADSESMGEAMEESDQISEELLSKNALMDSLNSP